MARTPVTTTRFTPRDVSMIYAVRSRASELGYQIDSDADALRWALAVACEATKASWAKGAAKRSAGKTIACYRHGAKS